MRAYRLTLIEEQFGTDNKQIGEPVEVPAPPHRGELLVHDGGVWEVLRTQTELPHPREDAEEARQPIHVSALVELAHEQNII